MRIERKGTYDFPPKLEPSWASRVDRWYQLDARAFAITELGVELRKELPLPDAILLISPGGSNASDFHFAEEGGISAIRFAHTLPNVRISPLLQALEWKGPVLSLQWHPFELETALTQAGLLFPQKRVWILSAENSPKAVAQALCLDLTQSIT